MPDLSRRFFVFGTAAAVAAASVPLVTADAVIIKPFTPVIAPRPYLRRVVTGLFASFDHGRQKVTEGELADIKLLVEGRDRPFLHVGVNTLGFYSWAASELDGMIVRENETFSLQLESKTAAIGNIELTVADTVDEGPPVHRVEYHTFPSRGPALILPLYPDNSFEARVRREEERKEAMAKADFGFIDDEDEDHYDMID